MPMIAYSRGSKCPTGAASLKYRMPAIFGLLCFHSDIAQWVEQRTDNSLVAGSNPAFQN